MTRKERIMATLRGEAVDRPAVCFYELNGYDENPDDPDPFNIYSHPSWIPLIELTRDKTDRIVMRPPEFKRDASAIDKLTKVTTWFDAQGSKHELTEIEAPGKTLRQHTRRDKDVNTIWTLEHFLKDEEDLKIWLSLPHEEEIGIPDYTNILDTEEKLGDTGIVMIDTADALCEIASLFDMQEYMVAAMMEQELFREALDRAQAILRKKVEKVARDLPGRLWRFYGPEYATPPYLPPYLYEDYVVKYDKELIDIIKKYGGFVRIHQHGKSRDVLDYTVKMGCVGIDPIEPVPQGDVSLEYVRDKYGEELVLFGNLEINDIELLKPEQFERKVWTALEEGTKGKGKGFVLMPSASPYGRYLSDVAYNNYKKIIEVVEEFGRR